MERARQRLRGSSWQNYVHCPNFVNADIIADRLSLQAPESAAITAAREMLEKSKRRPIHMRILTVAGARAPEFDSGLEAARQ